MKQKSNKRSMAETIIPGRQKGKAQRKAKRCTDRKGPNRGRELHSYFQHDGHVFFLKIWQFKKQ
jgi:hypothetical protein